MTKLLTRAALFFAVILSGHASAQTSPAVGVRVKSSDLDLSSVAGRETLLARVDHAVRKVCPGPAGGFYETLERQRCIRDTTADAHRKAEVVIARANPRRQIDAGLAAR